MSDPLIGIARSLNYALEAFGFEVRSELELSAYIGPPLEGSLLELTGRDDKAFIAAMVAKYRERYLDVGYRENSLYPGVVESLQALQRAGQRMAVCTSKPERTARLVLDLFHLDSYFEFVSGGDIGVTKVMQIKQLLADSVVSSGSLMIGDRAVDLVAGQQNGLCAGAVLWGYGSRAELARHSPAHYFERPEQWLKLLN